MESKDKRILKKFETSNRRKSMDIKCFELKIQENKLSNTQHEKLISFFKHAKYLTNDMIANDPFKYDYKTKTANVKWFDSEKTEHNELKEINLPSQIKQDIKAKIITDISNLAKKKKHGFKNGKLKFRKEINCIGLKQYNTTWKFGEKNKMHIAGIGWMKVNGKTQITNDIFEWGNAKLIKKATGFFIQVTGFKNKIVNENTVEIESKDIIGLDFGIKNHITLSNSEKYNFNFEKQENKIKRQQKQLSRKTKGSNNRYKEILKLKKQHQKLTNQKNDKANKFVSKLKNEYKLICMQDENIKAWHSGLFGKQIQHSILGRIKSKLQKLNTTQVVDRFSPTTQVCPLCGTKNKLKLSDRIYNCECGFNCDRDIKSAQCVVIFALQKFVGTEHTNFKPVEILTSDCDEKYNLLFNTFKLESLKQEVTTL